MIVFAPYGASTTIDVTQSTQAVALPTMPSGTPAISLVSRQSSMGAIYVKFGGSGVTVTVDDGHKISAGSPEERTILGVPAGETYIAILCDGTPGKVTLTSGSLPETATLTGAASATDNAVVRFDGTGGKTFQNSGVIIDDSNNVSGVGTLASGAQTITGTLGVSSDVAVNTNKFNVTGSNGNTTVGGTLTVTGLITATAGQIAFPATQSASAGANTLDDYEEGTWTPVFTFPTPGNLSISYATQQGSYVKVGSLVSLQFEIVSSAFTHTTASGAISITGLPFACRSTYGFTNLGRWNGITKANYTDCFVDVTPTSSALRVLMSGSGQTAALVAASDTPTGGQIILCCHLMYQT